MLSFCFYLVIEQLSRLILVFNIHYPSYIELFNLDIWFLSFFIQNLSVSFFNNLVNLLFQFFKTSLSVHNFHSLQEQKGLIYPPVLRIRNSYAYFEVSYVEIQYTSNSHNIQNKQSCQSENILECGLLKISSVLCCFV